MPSTGRPRNASASGNSQRIPRQRVPGGGKTVKIRAMHARVSRGMVAFTFFFRGESPAQAVRD